MRYPCKLSFRSVLSSVIIVMMLILTLIPAHIEASGVVNRKKRSPGARFGLKGGFSTSSGSIEIISEDSGSDDSGFTAGAQAAISQSMRKALEGDLGYLCHEVDVMDPQIAAVVIERSLSRPKNGMPTNWRVETPPTPVKTTSPLKEAVSTATASPAAKDALSSTATTPTAAAAAVKAKQPERTAAAAKTKKTAKTRQHKQMSLPSFFTPKRLPLMPLLAAGAVLAIGFTPVGAVTKAVLSRAFTLLPRPTIGLAKVAAGNSATAVLGRVDTPQQRGAVGRSNARISAAADVSAGAHHIDLRALEEVRHDTPLDALHMNCLILKNKCL